MHLAKKIATQEIAALIIILTFMICLILPHFPGVPVLNYHRIDDAAYNALALSSAEFDKQMAYLHQEGYTAITPDQLIDYLEHRKPLPPNPILITFDDGYEDNYQIAYPILRKYHFTATIFLITDFVGNNGRYLNWKQVEEMRKNGFYFESHSLNHILLTEASDENVRSQLAKSKEAIEWRLGQKVDYLAYPKGEYNQRIIALARQAGYRAAFTVNFGRDAEHCELFTLNRIPVFKGDNSFLHFWLRLKFTHVISTLQNFKAFLQKREVPLIARLIYIP